jgi:hypothetical protein
MLKHFLVGKNHNCASAANNFAHLSAVGGAKKLCICGNSFFAHLSAVGHWRQFKDAFSIPKLLQVALTLYTTANRAKKPLLGFLNLFNDLKSFGKP